ncbi:MAG TPA: hypothetical protein VEX38_03940, partial [Fimbriimonadaceae bacterium]|nr:hypothetical protein [Fimbriimonadaceae bacterium]
MATADELIQSAFERLALTPGYTERPDQQQLALLISDCIAGASTGAFEAPTGLGKSLATLIPAIAHAIASGKRTVIATYTNVLAEQYWRNDLPLALSLFPDAAVKSQFLIGRQRYACLAAIGKDSPNALKEFGIFAKLGIETEFRQWVRKPAREMTQIWQSIAAPPVCPGRLCPYYHDCYYYKARRGAEKAEIVITNHSVVLQDALLRRASEGDLTMLGEYDFLIIDEAHDFTQAAMNSLEFELSESKLGLLSGIAQRMHAAILPLAAEARAEEGWTGMCDAFRSCLERCAVQLKAYTLSHGQGILAASPDIVWSHPQVKNASNSAGLDAARELTSEIGDLTLQFVRGVEEVLKSWVSAEAIDKAKADAARDAVGNYSMYLREFGLGCQSMFSQVEEPL